MTRPRLAELAVHPVKSTARRPVTEARVLPRGLADDRSWVVVGGDRVAVTARDAPALLQIVADTPVTDPSVSSALRLRAPGAETLEIGPTPSSGELVPVRLFSNHLQGRAAGAEADGWIRSRLGRNDVRLLWCHDPQARQLNPAHSEPGDHTAFADGYPVTVASQASLEQLNDWITETAASRGDGDPPQVGQERFRANLVVTGTPAFAEDRWQRIEVGPVRLRRAKQVDRCAITTIEPRSLARGAEPLRTLGVHRRSERGVLFAVHFIPETTGTIRAGDRVTVLE